MESKGSSFVRRKRKENKFTQLSNEMLRDERLSWKARGLLSYMLSMPDDWVFYESELVNHSKQDGITSLRSAMKELKEVGYVKKEGLRDTNGKIVKWVTYVDEEPIYQITENLECGKPTMWENQNVDNQTLLIPINTKTENNTNKKHNVAKAPVVASKNVMPVEMMEMIIDYLNNKFEKKKNYRLSDTYKKLFNALYKAGHRDIGEYQYVIDNKYSEWIGTDMQTYIRPATLFAKEKFEKYIDEEPFVAYSNNKHQQQLKPWEVEAYNEQTTSWNDNVDDRGSISKPVPYKQLGINF